MLKQIAIVLLLAALVTSCASTEPYTKGQVGAATGAVAGALVGQAIGRDTGATLIGLAVGGTLGYIIGNEMDKYDRDRLTRVYETAPSYETTTWVNPDSRKQYTVTPQPAYTQPETRRVCRPADILTTIDGRAEKVKAVACRNEAGDWEMQQ